MTPAGVSCRHDLRLSRAVRLANEMGFPWGIAIDRAGNVYVTDMFGGADEAVGIGTLQKFAPLPPLAP